MRRSFWTTIKRFLLGVPVAAVLSASALMAAEPNETLNDLKARLDALEKQNQELKKSIEKGGIRPAADDGAEPDGKAVKKIVDDYMKDKDAAKKKDEDAAKKKLEEEGYTVGTDLKINTRWDGYGLKFETPQKDFQLHIGGRFNFDSVWFDQSPQLRPVPQTGDYVDGQFFRRLRIQMDGTFWEIFEFNTEYQFEQVTNGIPNLDEFWVGTKEIPYIGNVRIGHLKMQQGLESLSSSKDITFLERSSTFDAFWQEFATGVMIQNSALDQRVTWAGMFFRPDHAANNGPSNNEGAAFGDGEYGINGRVTALPIYENEGRCLVHVGASYVYRHALKADTAINGQTPTGPALVRFRSRLEQRDTIALLTIGNAGRLVDTGTLDSSDLGVGAAEFFSVFGPFSLTAEYAFATAFDTLSAGSRGDRNFNGGYVQASYFLTGENRQYDKRLGRYNSRYIDKPFTQFYVVRGDDGYHAGLGAVEVAGRYSYLNLNDGPVRGGVQGEWTLGLNWYLCPNFKIQGQYTSGNRWDLAPGQVSGTVEGVGVRTVLEF